MPDYLPKQSEKTRELLQQIRSSQQAHHFASGSDDKTPTSYTPTSPKFYMYSSSDNLRKKKVEFVSNKSSEELEPIDESRTETESYGDDVIS